MLDERYESISKILEIPLFYDSPEIRKVVEDIRQTRTAILVIANSIGASIDSVEEEEDEIVNEED